MEITAPGLEQLEAEFLRVESLVLTTYAQEYASEVYGLPRHEDEHEIARRNFFVCMFGLVDRTKLTTLADRCNFLNQKSTEISSDAAQEAGINRFYPINDSPATWKKRYRELFAAMNMKGYVNKDEISFSMFVSLHEKEGKYSHDLNLRVI